MSSRQTGRERAVSPEEELDHIRRATGTEPSVEMALDLGRSYKGLHYATERHGIPILVPDKDGRPFALYRKGKYPVMDLQSAIKARDELKASGKQGFIMQTGRGFIVVERNDTKE